MRARASAVALPTATCFGPGVGPLAVGMLNVTRSKAGFGNEAVRYSLLPAAIAITLGVPCSFGLRVSFAPTSSGRPDLSTHVPDYD